MYFQNCRPLVEILSCAHKSILALKEFAIDIYFKIIEKMIVFEGNKIIVGLIDGVEVEVFLNKGLKIAE